MIDVYNLFSRFVKRDVLETHISETSKLQGYNDRLAEAMYNSAKYKAVIESIDTYICSINDKFIFDKLRQSNGTVLFVEPGVVSLPSHLEEDQRVSIMVVEPFSVDNNDAINESIVLDHTLETLLTIVDKLFEFQTDGSLPCSATISVENEITPIPYDAFEQHTGWQVFIHIKIPRC